MYSSTLLATVVALLATTTTAAPTTPSSSVSLDFQTSEAGNPFVEGFYADPDTEFYDGKYWVYPTSSYVYDKQTYLDAFSSTDLVHWTKHSTVLNGSDFDWVKRAVWAPAPVRRKGKYYLFFGANDIQVGDGQVGGIGVGVANKPEGPYLDAIGSPLIGAFHNGAQPIDQDVFVDDDGQAYIYYGGHSHANVAKLSEDLTSLDTFDDGTTFKEITPQNYVEGIQMMKRNGKYYLFWSEGGWTGPDYAVSYAISDSPTGPFKRLAKILQQDSAVATGSGHNGIIHVPNTDIYYIVYHRHPLGSRDGNDRHLAYDRLTFNADGTIQPVKMLVHDNFNDGNMIGWKEYDGHWDPTSNSLKVIFSFGGKVLLNTNFTDFIYDGDVRIDYKNGGDAGLLFRVSNPAIGTDAYRGYYAGISSIGSVVLGRVNNGWTELKRAPADIAIRTSHHVRIIAKGDEISVYVDDMNTPKIKVNDGTFKSGMNGVRVYTTDATFDNIKIGHL